MSKLFDIFGDDNEEKVEDDGNLRLRKEEEVCFNTI